MTPRDTPQSTDRDGLVEKIARGIWASEFNKSPEQCRAEPATDEDPDPGWWVDDQWDAVLDTARAALAVVERERPPLTEELEFLREQLELKGSASVDRVLRALQDRDKEFDRAEAAEAKLAEAQLELARERSVVQRLDYGLAVAQKDMDRALIARDQARAEAQQLRAALASSTTEEQSGG